MGVDFHEISYAFEGHQRPDFTAYQFENKQRRQKFIKNV